MDLAYTTAGGVVGAAVTNYLSRNQERRQLRAAVMQQLLRVAAVRDGIRDIVPSRRELGVTAVLEDGSDAERVQREAISDLVVAALSAGIPRRVLDFAGGSEERALQCEVIKLIDLRLEGVLGESLEELMTQCEQYRQATAHILLRVLWHPWQTRLRMRGRLRRLRQDAAALHRRQEAATSVLARHVDALTERLEGRQRTNTTGPAA
ncbi:hypothetical protein AB0953_35365 [Streptomyces sp. NPDC046866]|uniref:hypothetical protein n=1 Tax=Streptomyces sp. NPDC046866 TaxID=3154921 RepID=UPI003453522C